MTEVTTHAPNEGLLRRTRALVRALPALFPVVFALSFFLLNVWKNKRVAAFQIDADEGYALMQAFLVGRGHPLYVETFSDQPPGYTYLILVFTKLFGETPEVARLFTVLLVAIYLGALYDFFRRRFSGWPGHIAGLLSCAVLVSSEEFLRYGSAAMIGIPSLCCAGLAALSLAGAEGRRGRLATSGLLLSISLWIKPLSAPWVPLFFAFVFWDAWRHELTMRARWSRAAPFVLAFGGALLLGFLPVLLGPGKDILYGIHRLHSDEAWPGWEKAKGFVESDAWFVVPAFGFGVLACVGKNPVGIFGLGCLLTALLALSGYAPVWGHHRYLLLFPASFLFGLGLAELGSLARKSPRSVGGLAAATAALCVLWGSLWALPEGRLEKTSEVFEGKKRSSATLRKVEHLKRLAPDAKMMVSSELLISYRLGVEVAPQLAVVSRKRFNNGDLGSTKLTRLALASDPDIVLLTKRFRTSARERIRKAIRKTHRRVLKDWKGVQVYVRRKPDASKNQAPRPAKKVRREKAG